MATPKQVLFGTLEDLGKDDFKHFKWLLQQEEIVEGFPAIPKCRLEKANRMDTVDQMVQTYSMNAIKVTRMVLGEMKQNDLLEKLSNTISEPTENNKSRKFKTSPRDLH
uniref:Pyrin domain-containing protein n=1 Tax=Sparus aurata TaxID=8175 RepID=A0A671TXW0_SPAAU